MRHVISLFILMLALTLSQTGYSAEKPTVNKMDADAFMKMLLTQLAYQDPSKPMSNAEMVSQLSDLTMMEQNAELVASMEALRKQVYDTQGLYASNLVGKGVMVVANLFKVESGRQPEGEVLLNYETDELRIDIYHDGEKPGAVRPLASFDMGEQEKGQIAFDLDDLDESVKNGTYRMFAYAKVDSQELEMVIVQHSAVKSIVFPGNGAEILLDVDGIGLVPITSVTEFEGDFVVEELPHAEQQLAANVPHEQGLIPEGMSAGQVQQQLKKVKRGDETWTSNPLFELRESIKTSKKKPVTRRSALFRSL